MGNIGGRSALGTVTVCIKQICYRRFNLSLKTKSCVLQQMFPLQVYNAVSKDVQCKVRQSNFMSSKVDLSLIFCRGYARVVARDMVFRPAVLPFLGAQSANNLPPLLCLNPGTIVLIPPCTNNIIVPLLQVSDELLLHEQMLNRTNKKLKLQWDKYLSGRDI